MKATQEGLEVRMLTEVAKRMRETLSLKVEGKHSKDKPLRERRTQRKNGEEKTKGKKREGKKRQEKREGWRRKHRKGAKWRKRKKPTKKREEKKNRTEN